MDLKFKEGNKVTADGQESVVKVAKKNFSTNVISYVLEDGRTIEETKLSKAGEKAPVTNTPNTSEPEKENPTLKDLVETYQRVFGKAVPPNKKKDEEWIKAKIEAEEKRLEEEKAKSGQDAVKYEALRKLSAEELEKLIEEKELDIDLADYETSEEVVIAICEELQIEIPKQ